MKTGKGDNMNIFQTIYNNTKIRCILAVCVCLWIAVMVQVVVTMAFEKDADITQAFAVDDNINIRKCSIEGTACLSCDRQSFDNEAIMLLENFALTFSGENGTDSITYSDEKLPCYKFECNTRDGDFHATVSWSDKMNQAYLHCNIQVKNTAEKMEEVHSLLKDVFDRAGKDGCISDDIIYSSIEADRMGRMSDSECTGCTDTMFGRLNAEKITGGGDVFYTVYGYTPDISDNIQSNGKKINVQVSYSYDEENDVTRISLGSPVLNSDY